MKRKIRVGVLFGGKSAEHEVSLQSAKNIIAALDPKKYEPILIGIEKDGSWHTLDRSQFLLNANDPKRIALNTRKSSLAVLPSGRDGGLVSLSAKNERKPIDVIFPILHGPFGEDGTVQGLLKLANVPFVGAGVLGSAVGMDKDVMKRLLRDAGIPIAPFLVLRKDALVSFEKIKKVLKAPVFVKPANLGSSVGVSKAKNKKEFEAAVKKAFQYDTKVLVEAFVPGREIECSVLGNENPIASLPGEIIPRHEFYSYEAKYLDEKGAVLEIPAKLSKKTVQKVQELAIRTFAALSCEGMARVDFFLKPSGEVVVNEINTIPGFTKISMYPKLWEATGVSYSQLIDRLIQLALQRYKRDQRLHTSR